MENIIEALAKLKQENLEMFKDVYDEINNIQLPETGEPGPIGPKGEDGKDGAQGPIGPKGEDGKDGKNGKDGAIGPKGKDGKNGKDGAIGPRGKDGKDGSPDTPEDIRNKLESLTGEDRLDKQYIRGLDHLPTKKELEKLLKQKTKGGLSVASFAGGNSDTTWGSITGTLSNQTDLQNALDAKVDGNSPITGATKTKVTYDTKGLVTAGADATTADINDSTNRRYVTDAQLTVIGNTSGTNTGDQTLNGLGGVPTSRQLTINGTAYDLSADRSWTVTSGWQGKDTTQTTLTGTGTETIMASILIPANTFAVGDGMWWTTALSKSAQTANDTWIVNVYLNNTNDLTTPSQLFTSATVASTVRSASYDKLRSALISGTTTLTQSGAPNPGDGGENANAWSSVTIPSITSDMYFIVTARHNGASQADTIQHRKTVIIKQ